MAEKTIELYLNDHLAGSTFGVDLARQICDRSEGTPFGRTMATVAAQIEQDRDTLVELIERFDVSRNPVKAAATWVAEKASRVKLSGATAGDPDIGMFMALEAMVLGVTGKLRLWEALRHVSAAFDELDEAEVDTLVERARSQIETLEAERLALASRTLAPAPSTVGSPE